MKNIIIFGAYGSIGNYILKQFMNEDQKYNVVGTSTCNDRKNEKIIYVTNENLENLLNIEKIDIVIWAQGYNFNDNIETFDINNFQKIMDGNVNFILTTLNYLLKNNKINKNAKMVIISSIWENYSRENKLSYSITKAALSGLVKNLAFDLSKQNILINNVLPGVIDNEMSRKTLSETEFNYVKNYMNFGRLITLEDVYNTIKFLVLYNTGITGQSITVDLGFTNLRKFK
jgi:NAD(P)-dependent dehydrogenase (short-subunit alcohol dehydrogenase family)